jgi:hypothetical protein
MGLVLGVLFMEYRGNYDTIQLKEKSREMKEIPSWQRLGPN